MRYKRKFMQNTGFYNIPSEIQMKIHPSSEGGFWAEFPDFPGCLTQADNLDDLLGQAEDAILTYFDVPRSEALKLQLFDRLLVDGKIIASRQNSTQYATI